MDDIGKQTIFAQEKNSGKCLMVFAAFPEIRGDRVMSSVLDLPMERQLELAERRGLTHPEWVEKMKSSLDECDSFMEKIQKAEREAKITRTPEEVANFQRRIDSGNPD